MTSNPAAIFSDAKACPSARDERCAQRSSMTRFIFFNRFFHPDHSATSQILSDLAFHLASLGREVHVITSQQLYDAPHANLAKQERVRNVNVHRVPTTAFGRAALWGRGFDYASYYASMWRCARSLASPGDVLIAKTDPPLTSVVALRVAQRANVKLVNWLQDIYPEAAAELRVPFMRGSIGHSLGHLRNQSLRRAQANVVVGRLMAERVKSFGVSAEHIHVIANWADDESLCPVAHANNPLRREWGLAGSFVIGYSGNLGRAHEFQTVLSGAERLRAHPYIVFLFIGGGHHFDQLTQAVRERGLQPMFRFIHYQPQEMLRYSLGVPDVHLVSLRPELEGLIVPSKIYGIAAVGRPIISVTAREGETAKLVRQYGCGLVVEPGDGASLAKAVVQLREDPQAVAVMGKRARAMLDAAFTRKQAFARWESCLATVISSKT
jgi:glycosyltransferase involved in cell wall biosynthesis